MRYQFVDCRWELGSPGKGRELYRLGLLMTLFFFAVFLVIGTAWILLITG